MTTNIPFGDGQQTFAAEFNHSTLCAILKDRQTKKEKINFEASTFYLLCFEREKDNRCSKEGKLQHNYNPNILEMYILLSYLEASSR